MFLRWTPLTAEQSRKTRNHVVEGGKVKIICNLPPTNMWKTSSLGLRRNLDQMKFFKMIYWVVPNQCIFGSLCQKIGPISPLEQVFEEVRSGMAEMDVSHEHNVFAVFWILKCVFGNIRLRNEYLAFSPWSEVWGWRKVDGERSITSIPPICHISKLGWAKVRESESALSFHSQPLAKLWEMRKWK